jgi:hypothetical protein
MLLEAVLVAALLFADLAVPAQALQAFGFHFVGDIFGAADFGFGHGGGCCCGCRWAVYGCWFVDVVWWRAGKSVWMLQYDGVGVRFGRAMREVTKP